MKKLSKNPENDYKQIDKDFDGKIKYFLLTNLKNRNIEDIRKDEEETLQNLKKQLEASKRTSILLMKEKGPIHASDEELMQKELAKEKLVKDAQELLTAYVEEYDKIRNAIMSEMSTQKDVKWAIENSKNRRRMIRAEIRTDKLFLVKQNEKVAALGEWIMRDAMEDYKKEKERANVLLQKAADFKLLEYKKQFTIKSSQTELLDRLNNEKGKYTTFLSQLREQADDLESKNQLDILEYKNLQLENENLTNAKYSLIENRVTKEVVEKIKENDCIDKALKSNGQGHALSEIKTLEQLSFADSDLQTVDYNCLMIDSV